MAYFQVVYEGKKYASRDVFMQVFGIWESRLVREPTKLILDTVVFGPLTKEQEEKLAKTDHIFQDIDAQLSSLVRATGREEKISIKVEEDKIIQHNGIDFVRLSDIAWSSKYKSTPRIATVRVCGRGIYVALSHISSDTVNPFVVQVA